MEQLEQKVLVYFRTFHQNSQPHLDRIFRDLKFQIPELKKYDLKNALLNLLQNKFITVHEGKYNLIDYYCLEYSERYLVRTPIIFHLEQGISNQIKRLAQNEGVTIQTYLEKIVAEYINNLNSSQ